jgi:hypothetical protein
MKLRRTVATYGACSPNEVASGSKAQMIYFVEDAQKDIAALADALADCQSVLAMMVAPNAIKRTTVLTAWAAATEAEAKARSVLGYAK